ARLRTASKSRGAPGPDCATTSPSTGLRAPAAIAAATGGIRGLPTSCSRLHPLACGMVDAAKEQARSRLAQVLVSGLARPTPVAVVVDDEDASHGQAGEQVDELVMGGIVPVGIQPQHRDLLWSHGRNRIFHAPRDEGDPVRRV